MAQARRTDFPWGTRLVHQRDLATVPKSKIGKRIGRLDDQDVVRLNCAVLVFLGLAGRGLQVGLEHAQVVATTFAAVT
jgi:hypothetical protein